ncbi:MAG: nitronate monooxygenase [Gemmatimonadota bacterium]
MTAGSPGDGSRLARLRALSRLPLWVAPMAGGPTTPELVTAAAQAGAFAFLAAGYLTPEALQAAMAAVRGPAGGAFGVNVFVPGAAATGPEVAEYVTSLAPDAARLGVSLGEPAWDDDHWPGKISVLLADPPPLVSFTFGCPPADTVAAFQARGTLVAVTVTSAGEAALAAGAGADCLCVQGPEAGAHRGTFTNQVAAAGGTGGAGGAAGGRGARLPELLAEVAAVTSLPLVAAGGLADPDEVSGVLKSGAAAAMLGTAFLRCPESGARPAHKAALTDPRFTATGVTRAFSGRPARGLVNQFMRDHPAAPAAYPEINNATRPLRAAAAAKGDADRLSLWAGTGYRSATDRPAAEIIAALARGTR